MLQRRLSPGCLPVVFILLSVSLFLNLALLLPPVPSEVASPSPLPHHLGGDPRRGGNIRGHVAAPQLKPSRAFPPPPPPTGQPPQRKTRTREEAEQLYDLMLHKKGTWDGSPIVVPEHKLLLLTVPKNACEEFKRLARRMYGFEDWRQTWDTKGPGRKYELPHDPRKNGLKYLGNFDRSAAVDMLASPDWTLAAFFRDPHERFLSAYLDKHVDTRAVREGEKEALAFPDFINAVGAGLKNRHWLAQCAYVTKQGCGGAKNMAECDGCRIVVESLDFAGRFSALGEDTEALLRMLPGDAWARYGETGWGEEGAGSIFQVAPDKKHATGSEKKWDKYFGGEEGQRAFDKVKQLFAVDFANLPGKTFQHTQS